MGLWGGVESLAKKPQTSADFSSKMGEREMRRAGDIREMGFIKVLTIDFSNTEFMCSSRFTTNFAPR